MVIPDSWARFGTPELDKKRTKLGDEDNKWTRFSGRVRA
jgi:hypothetical protein